MDGFGGGTTGYWRNRYYQRLDADDDGEDLLSSGASKPPSARRRKRPTTARRAKVVMAPPPPPLAHPSSSTEPVAASGGHSGSSYRPIQRRRRRRSWRIRLTPRLAFLRRAASFPARLLRRLQRGYVRAMLRFAGAMGGAAGPEAYALPMPAAKEYDEKVLVEVYRALVAQGHIMVVPAAEPGPDGTVVSMARLVAR